MKIIFKTVNDSSKRKFLGLEYLYLIIFVEYICDQYYFSTKWTLNLILIFLFLNLPIKFVHEKGEIISSSS